MCVYRYIFLLAYALNSGGAFVFLAESIVTKFSEKICQSSTALMHGICPLGFTNF